MLTYLYASPYPSIKKQKEMYNPITVNKNYNLFYILSDCYTYMYTYIFIHTHLQIFLDLQWSYVPNNCQ